MVVGSAAADLAVGLAAVLAVADLVAEAAEVAEVAVGLGAGLAVVVAVEEAAAEEAEHRA